jgi:hypothetical protein
LRTVRGAGVRIATFDRLDRGIFTYSPDEQACRRASLPAPFQENSIPLVTAPKPGT